MMSGGDWKDLYKGIENGDLNLVLFHIQNGIDINYQHPEILMTPLVVAIKYGHTDIALAIIQHGADLQLESYYDQMNPIEAAFKYKNKILINKFKSMGLKLNLFIKLKLLLSY